MSLYAAFDGIAQNTMHKYCMATTQAWKNFAGLERCFYTGLGPPLGYYILLCHP